jgi:hypothetical protein
VTPVAPGSLAYGIIGASRRRSAGASGYFAAVSALSPTAHWKLDEASGTTLSDAIGTKHLTLTGTGATMAVSTGLSGVGNGINFGGSAYGKIASALTAPGSTGISLAGWVHMNGVDGNGIKPLFCASFTSHVDPFYIFKLSPGASGAGSVYEWAVNVPSGSAFADRLPSATVMSNNAWHHFAFTYDCASHTGKMYVDNSNVVTDSGHASGSTWGTMGSFGLCVIPVLGTNIVNAKMAQWSYWNNYVLTSGDVSALWAAR